MRSRPVILGVLFTAVLVGGVTAPSAADDRKPKGRAEGLIDDAGQPTAVAVDVGGQPGQHASAPGSLTCEWSVWIEDDHELQVYETEGVPLYSATGRWLSETCRDNATGAVTGRIVPEDGVDPETVAERALQSVAIPDPMIRTNPVAERGLYVRVPTWLWIEPSWWTSYTATATAGSVTATVVASPVRVTWETGDGATASCAGPGTAWQSGMAEDATDCSHAYTSSSQIRPEGTFPLTATVELDVAWSSNIGASGSLGTISRSATETVRVGEIQAIETR